MRRPTILPFHSQDIEFSQTHTSDCHNPDTCPQLPGQPDEDSHTLSQIGFHTPEENYRSNEKALDRKHYVPDDADDRSLPWQQR